MSMADEKKVDEKKEENSGGALGSIWVLGLVVFIIFACSHPGGQLSVEQRNNTNTFKTQFYEANDINNLELLILCEASDQPRECQGAIAAVVYNRAKLNNCSITDCITAPGQFGVYADGCFWYNGNPVTSNDFPVDQVTKVRNIVSSVLNGYDPTTPIGGALYYYRGYQDDGIRDKLHFGDYFFYREYS